MFDLEQTKVAELSVERANVVEEVVELGVEERDGNELGVEEGDWDELGVEEVDGNDFCVEEGDGNELNVEEGEGNELDVEEGEEYDHGVEKGDGNVLGFKKFLFKFKPRVERGDTEPLQHHGEEVGDLNFAVEEGEGGGDHLAEDASVCEYFAEEAEYELFLQEENTSKSEEEEELGEDRDESNSDSLGDKAGARKLVCYSSSSDDSEDNISLLSRVFEEFGEPERIDCNFELNISDPVLDDDVDEETTSLGDQELDRGLTLEETVVSSDLLNSAPSSPPSRTTSVTSSVLVPSDSELVERNRELENSASNSPESSVAEGDTETTAPSHITPPPAESPPAATQLPSMS